MKSLAYKRKDRADKNSGPDEFRFEDPEFQKEFDLLTSDDDRNDYLLAYKAYSRTEPEQSITIEEMKALLDAE